MKITRHHADVAIVGSGIVGGSAALALARRGLSVMVLERDYYGSHSSGVNFGAVRRQGRPLAQLPLAARANEIWAKLPELIGTDGGFVRCGHLKLARNEIELAAIESYRERSRDYLDLHLLRKEELRAKYSWLGPRVIGASLCRDDGHANPKSVSQAFARAASAAGAVLRERTRIDEMLFDGTEFLISSSDTGVEVRSQYLLNCAGAWANAIAIRFGEQVPLASGHPIMAVTEPLDPFMNASVASEGYGVYARQTPQGHCVVGSARNYGHAEYGDKGSTERATLMMKRAAELVPALKRVRAIRTWSGTEGYLPDNEPVIGKSGTTPGLMHGFGFAGAGFLLGPAVGSVLAELVVDSKTETPIDAFSIERFPRVKLDAQDRANSMHFVNASPKAAAIRPMS